MFHFYNPWKRQKIIGFRGVARTPQTTKMESFYCKKIKFSFKHFFRKCDQIRRETADLVTFTEEILNGKLHFLCSVCNNL